MQGLTQFVANLGSERQQRGSAVSDRPLGLYLTAGPPGVWGWQSAPSCCSSSSKRAGGGHGRARSSLARTWGRTICGWMSHRTSTARTPYRLGPSTALSRVGGSHRYVDTRTRRGVQTGCTGASRPRLQSLAEMMHATQGVRLGLTSFPSGHSHSGWLPLPIALMYAVPLLPPAALPLHAPLRDCAPSRQRLTGCDCLPWRGCAMYTAVVPTGGLSCHR
jgi:hypothetical protein